ncbi:hypothetical protein MTO96_029532 [Rhipicephalus appendiculatus]
MPSNTDQTGTPASPSAQESTSGLQVLKPRSPVPTAKKAPNYWENKGVGESDDTRDATTPPPPTAGALEGADDSGSAETDAEQTAGRGLEASSAESSRESWPVSQTESDEQEVPKTEGPPPTVTRTQYHAMMTRISRRCPLRPAA